MKFDKCYMITYIVKNKNACGGKIVFKFLGYKMQQFFDTYEEAKKAFEEAKNKNKLGEVLGYSIYKCEEIEKTEGNKTTYLID